MPQTIQRQSIAVPLANGDILTLQRFRGAESGPPVLMLHGAIENGRIFYSESGKGLAPYLARFPEYTKMVRALMPLSTISHRCWHGSKQRNNRKG